MMSLTDPAGPPRHTDGSAGDADYGRIGLGYARYRRPDPRLAALIVAALGDAAHILNVGAGAGSYEPGDRQVTAVEPSAAMRAQRPDHLPPAIDAVAGALPFEAGRFDAAMAILSLHQWPDPAAGLVEMRRVTRGPVVVMTCDLARLRRFWLYDYVPELLAVEAARFPGIGAVVEALGGNCEVDVVPIPLDCSDGFVEAYYGRPEAMLDPAARLACSSWSFVDPSLIERFDRDLRRDLASGAWDARHGRLRGQPSLEGSMTLVIAR